jgi:hypothetical protein
MPKKSQGARNRANNSRTSEIKVERNFGKESTTF